MSRQFNQSGSTCGPRPWARRFVLAQIAVQIGIALTPFWSTTVWALQNKDDSRMLSGSAGQASALGQAAQSGNLKGLASQQATGMATQQVQQWLQGFGTARVELGSDEKFKVHTGALDLLVPLSKSDDRLLFTQGGVRNKDGQLTGNLGLGQRHFVGDWMLGYNAFYDHNMSRDHKRMGVGAEAWRDNLKLSGNGYYRLSGWKTSPDVEDYDERPANGFDLRAEAYLPAYPALGGRLMYEKYYGNEVGLFGKDNRQKNPDAVTAGLSYTPVPMVSLTADHKKGGSQSETQFGLGLTYQLGVPFSQQIDPEMVGVRRSLAGSAMDLVERNNNIVLEYRKKQLVNFGLPKEITGASLKTVAIPYTLTTKYPLAGITWNDAALIAAGGKITDIGGGQYQLTMPAYVAGASNVYPLSGVATDARGNASPVASTLVTVTAPLVSVANTTVVASPATILADGKAVSTVTVTLIDEAGQVIPGMAPVLTAALQETLTLGAKSKSLPVAPAQIGGATETAANSGIYTFTLTAGTRVGVVTVTPSLSGTALKAVAVNEIADVANATIANGSLVLTVNGSAANGAAQNVATAKVTDPAGNPVAGAAVTFTLSGAAQAAAGGSLTVTSDADGNVSLAFTDTVAETVSVTASTAAGGAAKVDALFKADAATASLANSDLTTDKVSALANGVDNVTFTALVKDAHGNPVPDVAVSWTTDAGVLGAASGKTGPDGRISVTLSNTLAGNAQVAAQVNAAAAVNAPTVSFVADAGSAGIGAGDLVVDKTVITAGGADAATFTATVKDASGNVLANQTVTWTTTLGNLGSVTSVTDAVGVTTVTLTGLKSGTAQVTAATGTAAATPAPAVQIKADAATARIADASDLTVDKTMLVANGADVAAYKVVIKDANDNLVEGVTVTWGTSLGNLSGTTSVTNAAGEAVINLTGTVMGAAQATASVNGGAAVNAPLVTLTADTSSASIGAGDLIVDKTEATANGTELVTYTALVKDANGNILANLPVSWTTDRGTLASSSSMTGADGRATITLSSIQAGAAQVNAKPGSGTQAAAPSVLFKADATTASIAGGDITRDLAEIVANDVDVSTFSAIVKDANGNLVEGITVNWVTNLGTVIATSTTNAAGIATTTLKGTTVGVAQVTAAVNSITPVNAPTVTLKPDTSTVKIDSSNLTVDKRTIMADGTEAASFTAIVTDANGNPVPNMTVNWATDVGNLSVASGVTDSDGKVIVNLTAALSGPTTPDGLATVNAQVGSSAATDAPTVSLVVPAENYVGGPISFTFIDAPKSTTVAVTGRTGTITGNIQVHVLTAYPRQLGLVIRLVAPNGTSFLLKDRGDNMDVTDRVFTVDATGMNKAGNWSLSVDDYLDGGSDIGTGTVNWDITL